MIPKNNTLNLLLVVALLVIIFQAGCATTTVKETTLAPTEEVETASSISTIESGSRSGRNYRLKSNSCF